MRNHLFTFCALLWLLAVPSQAQTPVGLAPVPRPVFTQNGAPLVNGCLFSFAAGTSTPLATFSDSSGTVSNPNPLVLDANGTPSVSGNEVGIYLSSANYKFQLKAFGGTNCASGGSVWTADNINAASFLNLPNTWTAPQNFNAGAGNRDIIAGNINNTLWVDGVKYTTVQAAMTAANVLGGGIVMVPDGTYPVPATWYNGVYVAAQHPTRPNICQDATGVNCFNASASTSSVVFTAATSLTISDLTKMGIVGITIDFAGTGNLTMAGISASYFDFTVRHAATTAPCVTFTGTASNNGGVQDDFPYFGCSGGNAGMKFIQNGSGRGWYDARYGTVMLAETSAPAGTWTAIDFNSQCDSNKFDLILPFSGQAALNGIIFNSASTTVDNDANGIVISLFAVTAAAGSGKALTFNGPSVGNVITTGVLPWGGSNILQNNAVPASSASYIWTQASPTAGLFSQINAGGTVSASRFYTGNANATPLVAGDFAFSAGFGNTPNPNITTIAGTDGAFYLIFTSGGAGLGANPTLTLTFHDGVWINRPVCTVTRGDSSAPTTAYWAPTIPGTTATLILNFVGTPAASTGYVLSVTCVGKPN